jgi:hypothetical protein
MSDVASLEDERSCRTCKFCQGRDMFDRQPRPHLPICGKYMWIFRMGPKTNCQGWETDDDN